MRVLAIIPSRYGSSRFPGKPLIDLAGKSMIRRVYEGVLESSMVSKIIVATDDQRIFDEVLSFQGSVAMTSKTHSNGTGRCIELAEKNLEYDLVINVQGDEPLIESSQLDLLINAFSDPLVEIASLASAIVSKDDIVNENRVKVVLDQNNDALYFSRSVIPNIAKAATDMTFYKHIGIYAFRRSTLLETSDMAPCALELSESLEQLRWMYYGKKIRIVKTSTETPNIDTPEDVAKVLKMLK